jgi:hypothetical protein
MGNHRYRKIPHEVDAICFSGDNWDDLDVFLGDDIDKVQAVSRSETIGNEDGGWTMRPYVVLQVQTIDGNTAEVTPGNWLIRGIKGELYPCRADVFAETFAPVTDDDDPPPAPLTVDPAMLIDLPRP